MTKDSFTNNVIVHDSVKGIVGDINGGTLTQYIVSDQSVDRIKERDLIKESPYKGLEKFEAVDKDKFFGRDQLIASLSKGLEQNNLLLLQGASGSGKSSLVRAGLIPKFVDKKFDILTFVPDEDPFESLYACLRDKYRAKAKIAQTGEADTLIEVVRELKKDSRWLIFIDQFEELFTISQKAKRDKFIDSLVQLIELQDNSIKIVLTIRGDFSDKISRYPSLVSIYNSHSQLLADMSPSDLKLAIAEPAARNGVVFQEGLIDQIIDDFQGQNGCLPLLQYTLNLLWEKDNITDRLLNKQTYYDLGRVTGALQQQANKVYDELLPAEQQAARQIFSDLVDFVSGKPVSRRADQANFNGGVLKCTLDKLISNRLLVVSKQGKQKPMVAIAHEALLTSWEKLKGWIKEAEETIVLKNRLIDDAGHWSDLRTKEPQKADGELWSGSKLERVIELREQSTFINLSEDANQFIDASVAGRDRQLVEEKRRKRDKSLVRSAIGAMTIALSAIPLTLAGNVLWTLQHRSNVVFAKPGQNINGKTNYRLTYNQALIEAFPPRVINQIVFGIPGKIESTDCINVGILTKGDQRGEYSINLTAPKKPGVYYIQFGTEAQYDCNSNSIAPSAKTMWQSRDLKTDSEKSRIGVVIVGNPIDVIYHWSKVASAYNENIPERVTRTNIKDEGAIYVSLQDFSINPAMSN